MPFQLTQRADFFEEEVGLETTLKRPIVNTRDEPHADAQKYRRLHVIVGDANLSEVATFLKVGTTALVLSMIEDDWLRRDLAAGPAGAGAAPGVLRPDPGRARSSWPTARRSPRSRSQWEYLDRARKYAEEHGLECIGGDEVGGEVLRRWEAVLTGLETDPSTLAGQVDWVAKHRLHRRLPRAPRPPLGRRPPGRDGPPVPRPPAGEVAWPPGSGSSASRPTRRSTRPCTEPPPDTRAYFRGRCLQRWPESIVAANWDSLVFDVGGDPLRRVPMMEPLRGTEAHVGSLIDGCESAADLLEKLGQ